MITLKEVESIHDILNKFGGSKGIRDRGILESAINRPFQTFDQKDLYPLPVDKAAAINQKLSYQPESSDVASLFMDHGYLFFSVNVKKEEHSGAVDLLFNIYEGDIVTINEVFVTGNKKVDSEIILSMISLKPGELFNRSKLFVSQRKIAESGLVDPENVVPNLIPNASNKTVDIEFKVREL